MLNLLLGFLRQGPPLFATSTRWSPLPALGVSILIVVISLLAGQLLVAAVRSLHAGGPPGAELAPAAATVVFLLGMQASCIGLTLAAAGWDNVGLGERLSLRPSGKGWRGYIEALLGCIALTGIYNAFVYASGFTDLVADLKPFIGLLRSPAWMLAVVAVAAGAPLAEELLFRGFLLPPLSRSRLRFRGAALLTTLAWTGMHAGYSMAGMVEVFLIGLYFSWLLWRTGSLRVTLVCHAVFNSLVLLVLLVVPLPV